MWSLSKCSTLWAFSRTQLESLILQRTAALQVLSQRLLKVQDEERRKVARDLHDTTGQTLAALKISVALLQREFKHGERADALLSDIEMLADQALKEIRTTSYLLHPPLLEEAGFAAAARWYIEGFAKRSGIKVSLEFAVKSERLPFAIETTLFRVLQESLTNVLRHSGAREVVVYFRHLAGIATLEIRDFGRGIPPDLLNRLREASSDTGVGLAGMRERLNELNGKLEIESGSHGTSMRAIVSVLEMDPTGQPGKPQGHWLARKRQLIAENFAHNLPVANSRNTVSGFSKS